MAKIRKEGAHPVSEGMTDYAPVRINRAHIEPTKGGESTSDIQDGKDSLASSKTDEKSTQEPTANRPEHAPTTESPLPKEAQAPLDANSTGGRGRMTKAQPSGKAPAKKANVRSTSEDDF